MKKIIIFCCSFLLLHHIKAQGFSKAEYFFDTDPGINNGFQIPLSGVSDSLNFTANIPILTLPTGFHLLCIRVKHNEGNWSLFESRGFYISTTTSSVNVEAVEYFFDNDPGVGAGSPASVGVSGATVNFTVPIVASLSPGFHLLAIRTKDANGKWGLFESRGFYISTTTSSVNIVAAEYFFDTDPGVGAANPASVGVNGGTVNFSAVIPASLSPGFHLLAIRTKDVIGNWGLFESRGFYISTMSTSVNVVAGEYFYDADPGVGKGFPLTGLIAGSTVNQIFPLTQSQNLSQGPHLVVIRVKDASGKWGLFEYAEITVVATGQCYITNILANPGFDLPPMPNNGDNLLNAYTFNEWTMTGGQGFNIVKPNGSYGPGPDDAKDGTQFAEVSYGNGTVYQDFTILGANKNIFFGGYYSSRTGAPWSTSISIYSMPGNTLVSTSNVLQYTNQGNKVWLPVQGTTTLSAGNYRFIATIPDDANFDASFAYISESCTLPIHLLSFSAALQNTNDSKLQWKIATPEAGGKYELQRSKDGRTFATINQQTGNASITQFDYTDYNLPNATYYYRLKMTDKDGKITYSYIAVLKVGSKNQLITTFPNPVKRGETLQLNLENVTAKNIEIVTMAGQIVYSNPLKVRGNMGITVPASWAAGQYLLKVISENNSSIQKIIIW